MEKLIREWKQNAEISETRRRPEMLEAYLTAWDLREGWTGDDYDVDREHTFADIGRMTGESPQTAAGRHRSAFRLVCGHEYSLETWARLFCVVKLAGKFGVQALMRRRVNVGGKSARGLKLIPETTLSTNDSGGDGGWIARSALAPSSEDTTMLVLEIEEKIKQGLHDDAIVKVMEFDDPSAGRELVHYFRKKLSIPAPT
jgi:hypothetical protein